MAQPVKVLFICIGNSCRSQMAEALVRHLASDVMDPSSAGLAPLGTIAAATRAVLAEGGISVNGQFSKGLPEVDADSAQIVVNMSGHPIESYFAGSKARFEDWDIADPYGADPELHRQIRDEIEERVNNLAERLRRKPREARRA